jgi:hypothetical protein
MPYLVAVFASGDANSSNGLSLATFASDAKRANIMPFGYSTNGQSPSTDKKMMNDG